VCAWVDISNGFHPESAAASGVDLSWLLWVCCGIPANNVQHSPQTDFSLPDRYFVPPPIKRGLHGGGFVPHPRSEAKGLSEAVGSLFRPEASAPRCAEPQRIVHQERAVFEPQVSLPKMDRRKAPSGKPWFRLDQALLVTDLLLQGSGFSAIVLDSSLAPR
jgi:recombination protein RecA